MLRGVICASSDARLTRGAQNRPLEFTFARVSAARERDATHMLRCERVRVTPICYGARAKTREVS